MPVFQSAPSGQVTTSGHGQYSLRSYDITWSPETCVQQCLFLLHLQVARGSDDCTLCSVFSMPTSTNRGCHKYLTKQFHWCLCAVSCRGMREMPSNHEVLVSIFLCAIAPRLVFLLGIGELQLLAGRLHYLKYIFLMDVNVDMSCLCTAELWTDTIFCISCKILATWSHETETTAISLWLFFSLSVFSKVSWEWR